MWNAILPGTPVALLIVVRPPSRPRVRAIVVAVSAAACLCATLQAETKRASPARTVARAQRPRFTEYQVPAGTTLAIELRTRLSSNGSRPEDAIEGRLRRALISRDGAELVPAGAPVLGTVREAEAAGPRQRGRLAFTFQVVEHPSTGSRAMIKAEMLTFESAPPVKGHVFADVQIEKGTEASILLVAPLVVRIPVAN